MAAPRPILTTEPTDFPYNKAPSPMAPKIREPKKSEAEGMGIERSFLHSLARLCPSQPLAGLGMEGKHMQEGPGDNLQI